MRRTLPISFVLLLSLGCYEQQVPRRGGTAPAGPDDDDTTDDDDLADDDDVAGDDDDAADDDDSGEPTPECNCELNVSGGSASWGLVGLALLWRRRR